MIKLGQEARDKITGFKGIITGRAQYIYGCDQYCLVPPAKDGQLEATQWFDEGRIRVIGKGVSPENVRVERPGGPQRDCPKA